MKCISLPPSRLPSGLASFGRTTSAICDCDSLTARGGTIWIGVSWPSCEFILSFSHEGFSYRALRGRNLPEVATRHIDDAKHSKPGHNDCLCLSSHSRSSRGVAAGSLGS